MKTNRTSLRSRIAAAVVSVGLAGAASPSPSAEPAVRLDTLESIVDAVEQLVREARFHTAIGVARTAQGWSEAANDTPQLRAPYARLEVLAATAHVALEQHERARDRLRRALALDPDLSLDEQNTSPKLLEVLRTIQPAAAPGGSDS